MGRYTPFHTRPSELVVAASNSPTKLRNRVDYICDGVNDETEINTALSALTNGGEVRLLPGTFIISGSILVPSNVKLSGSGFSTIVKSGGTKDFNIISNSDTSGGNSNIIISSLTIDGDQNDQNTGQRGINFGGTVDSSVLHVLVKSVGYDCIRIFGNNAERNIITNCLLTAPYHNGVALQAKRNTVGDCIFNGCRNGIEFYGANALYNTISNCVINSSGNTGIMIETANANGDCSYNIITGCTIRGTTWIPIGGYGIYQYSSAYWTYGNIVTNCSFINNDKEGIKIDAFAKDWIISNNLFLGNSQLTHNTYDNLSLKSSDYNLITNNVFRKGALAKKPRYGINISNNLCDRNLLIGNDLYDSGETGDLNDTSTTNPTIKNANRNLAGTNWLAEKPTTPENILRGIVPVASGWGTDPTNLERCTDGGLATVTGTGSKVTAAAGNYGVLMFDLGTAKTVMVGGKVGLWSSAGTVSVLIEHSEDNITWHFESGNALITVTTTELFCAFRMYLITCRYFRMRFYVNAASTAYAKIYEVMGWELQP